MKYCLIILGLFTSPVFAQRAPSLTSLPEQPEGSEGASLFKRANVLIIHTTDSTSVAYTKIARILLADGYAIEKADKELGYINTQYRTTAVSRALQAALRFTIAPGTSETRIELRGTGLMPGFPTLGTMRLEARGQGGSPISTAWAEMQRVATLYPGAQLSYKRER